MNTIELIKALSASTSRTDKEQLLMQAFMTGERTFFAGARLAYDPLMTFGIQKVALIEEEDDEPGRFTFQQFIEIVRRLAQRELTGPEARDVINEAADDCHVETWNLFYRRILLKDLKVGVEAKTINKILTRASALHPEATQFLIPIFGVQIAADGKKPEIVKKLEGRRLIDVKMDGSRIVTILDKENDMVIQFNRNGKINEDFPNITNALKLLMAELPASVMLDGSMVGASFEILMQPNKENVSKNLQLALFDIIPLSDFNRGRCKIKQETRHEALCEIQTTGLLAKYCGSSVYVIPKVLVDLDTEEGQTTMNEVKSKYLAAGFEGIILKDPEAPYVASKNSGWVSV